MIVIITTEFTVIVVIVAVSACFLPVRPVGIVIRLLSRSNA